MKKRIVSLILAAVMVFGLTACGGGSSTTTVAPQPEQTTQAPATTTKAPDATQAPATTTKAPDTTKTPETTPEPTTEAPEDTRVRRTVNFIGSNVATFNPLLANSAEDTFQTFTGARPYRKFPTGDGVNADYEPDLAEDFPYQVDSEGKVWRFKIREGLYFVDHNGNLTDVPINAHTVEFTAKMALDPIQLNRAGDNMQTQITIVNAKAYYTQKDTNSVKWEDVGLKAIDDYTIELTLVVATNARCIMKQFSGYATCPVPEKMYTELMSADGTSTEYGTSVDKYLYSGAMYCTDWVKESTTTCKKNPYYCHADKIKLNEVVHWYVPSYQTAVQMFEAGELDYVSLDAEQVFKYLESPYLISYPSTYLTQLEVCDVSVWYEPEKDENGKVIFDEATGYAKLIKHETPMEEITKPILCDVNFRKAMFYAIDRVALAKLTKCTPATYIIADTSEAYEDGTMFKDTELAKAYRLTPQEAYNEALAKELFDKAWEADAGKSLTNGKLEIHLIINSDSTATESRMIAQYLQEQFPKVFGADKFELVIDEMPSKTRLSTIKAWRENVNAYDMSLSNWSRSTTNESPFNALDVYSASFYQKCNNSYHCETIEQIIWLQNTDPRVKTDREFNTEMAAVMEKAALEQMISVPMVERTNNYLVSDDIELAVDPMTVLGFYTLYCDVLED